MENLHNLGTAELDRDQKSDICGASPSYNQGHQLNSRKHIHQIMGAGKAADVILWKRQGASFGVILLATVTWLLFEHSGLPFLSVCSDVLLAIIVLLFLRANYNVLRNKQLPEIPELVLSEEMVNYVASSFRVKLNSILLMAHDITLGKDFRIFFKVVVCLWIFSVIGSLVSLFTLAYIGSIVSISIPALYSKYQEHVDWIVGYVHQKFTKEYRVVDESVSKLPPHKDKDA